MADDIVIEAGGQEISGKDNVRNWEQEFLDHVNDLHVDTVETFQNEDGTRVTSRWVVTGTNNGILGTEPNGNPIALTGTAAWTVDDEKLQRGWVEQASFMDGRSGIAGGDVGKTEASVDGSSVYTITGTAVVSDAAHPGQTMNLPFEIEARPQPVASSACRRMLASMADIDTSRAWRPS